MEMGTLVEYQPVEVEEQPEQDEGMTYEQVAIEALRWIMNGEPANTVEFA